LVFTPVDLLTVAADVVHDARAGAPGHRIDLEVSVAPPVVLGDEPRLRQVLHNLVGNACRHTPSGTAVLVRLSTVADDALIEVVDHGPGLPAGDRQRIFDRFYRSDTARDRDSGGSGLGLAIVAALVSAHSGTVDVIDTPGSGATFRVQIPTIDPDGAAPARPRRQP
jgi:two-component system OmpR family sensor kinase